MTELLFQNNSYIRQFHSRIKQTIPLPNGSVGVVLEHTAFYPEGGGQPSDHGQINGLPVTDVYREGTDIIHVMSELPPTETVEAAIDWARRFDHMQQHTGQHILSAACHELFGAATVGFHMGAQSSQIDLDLPGFTDEELKSAEQAANELLVRNKAVSIHQATPATLHEYPLRKPPAKDFAAIRLIEIAGIDCCPCGGTHVAATGEIGIIKIRSWERKNNAIRLDFVCGYRALADYQYKNLLIQELSGRLSAPGPQLLAAFDKLLAKADETSRQLAAARQELSIQLADNLYRQAEPVKGIKIIAYQLANSSPAEVAGLARQLVSFPATVALLAGFAGDNSKVHLVFSCSPGLNLNMGAILKAALPLIEGKGGGSDTSAQGGGPAVHHAAHALELAEQSVIALL
ncbi:alanyl-tRNA synthetase [Anaerospora hongkongensis]|uniref:Alanyl-tRNA synthetase n=1 Tax=Anaerospora hongkongensis TaxID=244830 RepID=A0A4R1PMF0_9FIRM|nr:DHHA1 domain-containing protein [Anaerospora hongkongensis]TCL32464.1 alanyl-tRNA synthetase [Anaerospora hongkongensis]